MFQGRENIGLIQWVGILGISRENKKEHSSLEQFKTPSTKLNPFSALCWLKGTVRETWKGNQLKGSARPGNVHRGHHLIP